MFMGVLILCLVVAIMLWVFFFYHMWLVSLGQTTNENTKYAYYNHTLKRSLNFFEEWEQLKTTKGADALPD